MSHGEYSVYQFFKDGSCERVREFVDEQSAAEAFHHYTRSAGALIGFTVRVIITDGGDDTCAEWIHGEGITFPSECVGLA